MKLIVCILTFLLFFGVGKANAAPVGFANENILFSDTQTQDLEAMNDLGLTWLRVDANWERIQPTKNTYNWGIYDTLVANANAHNIKILFILDYAPKWGRANTSCRIGCAPNLSKFNTFAKTLVNRYAPKGVHAYEIWNEPNLRGFWSSSASTYASMLKSVYPVIKQADRQSIVVSGGLSPLATYARGETRDIPTTDFVTSMYKAGVKNYMDAFGYHPYGEQVLPFDYEEWNGWSIFNATTPSVQSIRQKYGDNKPVWFTEAGAPTDGQGGAAVSESFQAEELRQDIVLANGSPLFIYTYKDFSSNSNNSTEDFFGLIRFDGTRKPSYNVVKSTISN